MLKVLKLKVLKLKVLKNAKGAKNAKAVALPSLKKKGNKKGQIKL